MQIILEDAEIMEALDNYCAKQITVPEGKKLKVTFTVGRGDNGTRATIEFEDAEASQMPVKEPVTETPTTTSAKKKSVKKAEEEVAEIVETATKETILKEDPKEIPVDEPKDTVEAVTEPVTESAVATPTGNSLFKF